MWKLRGRDNKIKQWSEYGDFQNIADAADRIAELEGDGPGATLIFRVYVDTLTGDMPADNEILSRLRMPDRERFLLVRAQRLINGEYRPLPRVHVGCAAPEAASDCCFRCGRVEFEQIDEEELRRTVPLGVTLQGLRWRKP